MAKLCLNCNSRNPEKQIRCKTCGASLVRALGVRDGPNFTPLLVILLVVLVLFVVVWGPLLMTILSG